MTSKKLPVSLWSGKPLDLRSLPRVHLPALPSLSPSPEAEQLSYVWLGLSPGLEVHAILTARNVFPSMVSINCLVPRDCSHQDSHDASCSYSLLLFLSCSLLIVDFQPGRVSCTILRILFRYGLIAVWTDTGIHHPPITVNGELPLQVVVQLGLRRKTPHTEYSVLYPQY